MNLLPISIRSLRRTVGQPLPAEVEMPIRLAFLHEAHLRQLGHALAEGKINEFAGLESFDFEERIGEIADQLRAVYQSISEANERGELITPAAKWLLDNHYLVEETNVQIKRDLPRRYYRQLPRIALPQGDRLPRALTLAWLYVAHTDSAVSEDTFAAIVEGYQEVEPLTIGELWALPSLLRFALAENLRRLALRVDRARQMRRIANTFADQIASVSASESLEQVSAYGQHALDTTFAAAALTTMALRLAPIYPMSARSIRLPSRGALSAARAMRNAPWPH